MERQESEKLYEVPRKYSEEFKRKVVVEYLSTGVDKLSIQRKYGIRFKSAICTWMRQMGYEDISRKRPYFEILNRMELKKKFSKQEEDQQDEAFLKQRIKELERQLEDEKFRSEAFNMMIDVAEKELKISIRKKSNTK